MYFYKKFYMFIPQSLSILTQSYQVKLLGENRLRTLGDLSSQYLLWAFPFPVSIFQTLYTLKIWFFDPRSGHLLSSFIFSPSCPFPSLPPLACAFPKPFSHSNLSTNWLSSLRSARHLISISVCFILTSCSSPPPRLCWGRFIP